MEVGASVGSVFCGSLAGMVSGLAGRVRKPLLSGQCFRVRGADSGLAHLIKGALTKRGMVFSDEAELQIEFWKERRPFATTLETILWLGEENLGSFAYESAPVDQEPLDRVLVRGVTPKICRAILWQKFVRKRL